MKKSAFTLVESLVSLLIISAVGMAAMVFSSAYLKTTYDRDNQMSAVIANMNIAESLRAEVGTLPQLYEFSKNKEMKIIAVGVGEINLSVDGTYTVVNDESYMFSDKLKPKKTNLFRIEIGGSVPNTKITTVVMLR